MGVLSLGRSPIIPYQQARCPTKRSFGVNFFRAVSRPVWSSLHTVLKINVAKRA